MPAAIPIAACGTSMPDWMADLFDTLDDDLETRQLVAATFAAEQCRVLYAHGVKLFHFYTLNRSRATRLILESLRSN